MEGDLVLLEKQVKIYALDTGNFYSNTESRLHWHVNRLKRDKRLLLKRIELIERECSEVGLVNHNEVSLIKLGMEKSVAKYATKYGEYKNAVSIKNAAATAAKKNLLSLLSNKVAANISSNGTHHTRVLSEDTLSDKNIIAVFDSYFTRTIGAKQDELCEDFMVITKFYDDVMKDLIYYGFMYKGEKYVYFTSSAGQIRTKKTVFVKESVWKKYEKSIMCGLTVDDINAKGGNNPNKHLAYLALANSATDVWTEFDIDKTIVVDDFETEVYGTYDFPAHFMLCAAMNPCPCGYYPDLNKCTCTSGEISHYMGKISRPLLDRIDISTEVPPISFAQLHGGKRGETSAVIRKRVEKVQKIQEERYRDEEINFNGQLGSRQIDKYCPLTDGASRLLARAFDQIAFSARSYHRIMKVARTIADMDDEEIIASHHIGEALSYRVFDKNSVIK